ncbi:sensor histidine kinase [Massilia glaciei]|uniref:Sensor histidine kinase n=1 Tax=Massilia glaciei TaxID=1524097 RepID=A0A2U2HML9_9BURK|nr:histidine kinase [Massilia glaciei]PWF48692.1 sensor histidine kinase [Massilia glaciei]
MQGPFSTRRGAALYLAASLLLGLVMGALVVNTVGAAWSNGLLFAIPVTLVYCFATGFSAYYVCRAYPLAEKPPFSILTVLCLSAVVSAALLAAIGLAWNGLLQAAEVAWAGVEITAPLKAMIFGLGVVLYGLSAAVHYLAIEFGKARLAERRELESKLLAQEAELRMLRTQIDPHFLFNSLNSISALTGSNPAAARQMTLQLSDFFRLSLGLEAHTKVTLEAECALARHFLAIEKVRFGSRLTVEQDIADDAGPCLLPPLILQPLVENAVKHGIGNLVAGGAVRVAARRTGSVLRISVENDVDDDQPGAPGNGIGLANVRQRLAAAYGHEASVACALEDKLYRVSITLPAQTTES